MAFLFFIVSAHIEHPIVVLVYWIFHFCYLITLSTWVHYDGDAICSGSGLLLFSAQIVAHVALSLWLPIYFDIILVADATLVLAWILVEGDHLRKKLASALDALPVCVEYVCYTFPFALRIVMLGVGALTFVLSIATSHGFHRAPFLINMYYTVFSVFVCCLYVLGFVALALFWRYPMQREFGVGMAVSFYQTGLAVYRAILYRDVCDPWFTVLMALDVYLFVTWRLLEEFYPLDSLAFPTRDPCQSE